MEVCVAWERNLGCSPAHPRYPARQKGGGVMAPLIVLLGNDSSALAALHELSRDAGYRSLRCRPQGVTDAHGVVKRAQADLVILDLWTATREDGWAFLRRVWADIDTTDIPAIVVTDETEPLPIEVELLRTMRCRVLRKPVDARVLQSEIEAALERTPVLMARDNAPRSAPPGAAMTSYPHTTTTSGEI